MDRLSKYLLTPGEKSMHLFLQGWEIQFLEENVIRRSKKPKSVWEMVSVAR